MHPMVAENTGFGDIPSNHEGEIEVTGGVESFLDSDGVCAHPASMEQEKRIRREVANSNERRRMQSINAGFLTLRAMLPQREGEKLSKAAILQQTSDFICNLEQEKTRLLTQNCQLKRLLGPQSGGGESPDPPADSPAPPPLPPPPPPQSVVPCGVSQEELTSCEAPPLPDPLPLQALQLELQELRAQLERERLQRLSAEERLRQAEEQQQLLQQQQLEQLQQQEQQQRQEQQQQHCVHMRFKKPRLEEPVASPEMLVTEEHEMMSDDEEMVQSPPPPPVATRRPLYMGSSTSRQNLDTIVEAIRHLEGDHLFGDCPQPRLEPAQNRLEPHPARIETTQSRLEPIQARLEPLHGRLELPQPCLDLEPQEAPLELTTHARSSSVDAYRPAVIVAQHPPPPRH